MIEEALKCLSCPNPLCEKGCPLHNRIRDFIKACKEDDLPEARRILALENPFPYLTSRICAYDKQCYGHCVKGIKGEAVKIYELEKLVAELPEEMIKEAANGESIAVIGGGIGALTAAKLLLLKGYQVTIYEKENYLGGTLNSGIPPYRLPREYLQRAIKEVLTLGAKVNLKSEIKDDQSLKRLQAQFTKVIIAIGAMGTRHLNLPGSEYAVDGIELLNDLNIKALSAKYREFKKALVVGGGNVAFDCARSLKRLIPEVTIIYRRNIQAMPANPREIAAAQKEGVKIFELHNPSAIVSDAAGKVCGVKALEMVLGEKEADGRPSFKAVADSESFIAADLVVSAIGQKVSAPNFQGLELTERGMIACNEKGETSLKDVYVLGDAALGPSNAAKCIASAKRVVAAIAESKH